MSLLANDRLTTTLFLAGAVHAVIILGVTFTIGRPASMAPGLEVLLVSDELPEAHANDHASYLSQRTQRGSGNTRDQPTGSPRIAPPAPPGEQGERETTEATPTTRLSTTSPQPDIAYYQPEAESQRLPPVVGEANVQRYETGRGDAPELVLRGDPGTGHWLVADTQKSLVAPYLDAWRRKVERLGTLNYPNAARLASGSASPVIEVRLRSDGLLLSAAVQRSSGQPELDQAALNILKAASPFEAFPAELADAYGSLRFAYQWEFIGGRQAGTVTASTNGASAP